MSGKKVVIGLSGGVDSSAAAYILKNKGYDVLGVTVNTWEGSDSHEDAQRVADSLGIELRIIDYKEIFKEKVMDYFAQEYLHARTPNPCLVCNRFVKWEALLECAKEFGADYIATGHYARIKELPNGRFAVCRAESMAKDQSYALYNLTQRQLSHTLLPVGEYEKPEIRRIALEAGIPVANKDDSQEVCFIPDNDYAAFIEGYTHVSMPKGNFVNLEGEVIGEHQGLLHYTIGQRRGLNLPMGHRVFVKELRADKNEVVVAENEDMFTKIVKMNNVSYMGVDSFTEEEVFLGRIRYGHKGSPCTLKVTGEDEVTAYFEEAVRAPTPGQALVLYKEDYVALGGTIK